MRFPTALCALAFPAIVLSACTVIPDAPIVTGTPLPEGTAAGLSQPVQVGTVVITPREVVEDSRCPVDVQCAWAGRLIVRTRIDGAGWRDTADITLGETFGTHGVVIALTNAAPDRVSDEETPQAAYRFTYEAR